MPELPEVEVTRRSIAPYLAGAVVRSVRMGKPLRWPLGCAPDTLQGWAVGQTQRRGKYLWLPLETPNSSGMLGSPTAAVEGDSAGGGLLMHLGMSGSLAWHALPGPAGIHDHFDLVTDRGTLRLTDPRRFGAVVWSSALTEQPAQKLLQRLGPEPFDAALTPLAFHASLQRHRSPIKGVLLAGEAVVGAGNIYACEALFHAKINPRLASDKVSRPRAQALLAAVRGTLARAMSVGGSTLRDFKDAHGMAGEFQAEAQVYGREGLACRVCATPVRRIVQAQRSTFWCPQCQKR